MHSVKSQDARSSRRAQIAGVSVRYALATGDTGEGDALDIGKGGIFVKTDAPLPVGQQLAVDIRITGESTALPAVACVAWTRDVADEDGRPAGMALTFVEIDDAALERIARLIATREQTVQGLGMSGAPDGARGAPPKVREPTLVGVAPAAGEPRTAPKVRERTLVGVAPAAREPAAAPPAPSARATVSSPNAPPTSGVMSVEGAPSSVAARAARERTFLGLGTGDAHEVPIHAPPAREVSIPMDLVTRKRAPAAPVADDAEAPMPPPEVAAGSQPAVEGRAHAVEAPDPPVAIARASVAPRAVKPRRRGRFVLLVAAALTGATCFVLREPIASELQARGVSLEPLADMMSGAPTPPLAPPPVAELNAQASAAPTPVAPAGTASAKSARAVPHPAPSALTPSLAPALATAHAPPPRAAKPAASAARVRAAPSASARPAPPEKPKRAPVTTDDDESP